MDNAVKVGAIAMFLIGPLAGIYASFVGPAYAALVLGVFTLSCVAGIVAYLVWDARAGWMDGEDTIRRMAREARRKHGAR